jgi:arginine/lysine/ornithine decarboxylase
MPGENCGAPDGPHIAYLDALQEFDRRFPGFEHALHGVGRDDGDYTLTVIA